MYCETGIFPKNKYTYAQLAMQITKGNQSKCTVYAQCYSPVEVDAASECMVDV